MLLALAGCGGSNGDNASSSRVRLILRTTTAEQGVCPQTPSGAFGTIPPEIPRGDIRFVENVEITITGPGIPEPIVETFPLREDQQNLFQGEIVTPVPGGRDRRIRVTALNQSEIVIFRGEKMIKDLGPQATDCREMISLQADSICTVAICLDRLAVWGNFRWGDPAKWTR